MREGGFERNTIDILGEENSPALVYFTWGTKDHTIFNYVGTKSLQVTELVTVSRSDYQIGVF